MSITCENHVAYVQMYLLYSVTPLSFLGPIYCIYLSGDRLSCAV